MFSYRLQISYEGTLFYGWQKNSQLPTIELALETALKKLNLPLLYIEGASRTDRGVHALGQIARIDLERPLSNPTATLIGLNSQLPPSVRVMQLSPCSTQFHPTLDATGKTYDYSLCTGYAQSPLYRHFSWHLPTTLNLAWMEEAVQHLLGTHDFKALTNQKKGEVYTNHVRTLFDLQIFECEEGRFKIQVRGNQFLYKMVRNLVGLLAAIGSEKHPPSFAADLIRSGDRRRGPMTAPAHGLRLTQIHYD